MPALYNGKVYTNEETLYNDFSNNHPEIHHDNIVDAIEFGGEVVDVETCPVCGGIAGKWGSGCCSGRCWGDLYGEP